MDYYMFLILGLFLIKAAYKEADLKRPDNRPQIFVVSAYFYPKSSLFTIVPKSTIVMLLHLDKKDENMNPICLGQTIEGEFRKITSQIEPLFMHVVEPERNITSPIFNFHRVIWPMDSMIIETHFRLGRKSAIFQFPLKRVDPIKRNVVACPGRMLEAGQLGLFAAGMEIVRTHLVSLVIVHASSVEIDVFKLLKFFHQWKLLELRESFSPPNNQWDERLMNLNDCLYEFKENAEFIWFGDWDEIIYTDQWLPLHSLLKDEAIQLLIEEEATESTNVLPHIGFERLTYDDELSNIWKNDIIQIGGNVTSGASCSLLFHPKLQSDINFLNLHSCSQITVPVDRAFALQFQSKKNTIIEHPLTVKNVIMQSLFSDFNHFLAIEPSIKMALSEILNMPAKIGEPEMTVLKMKKKKCTTHKIEWTEVNSRYMRLSLMEKRKMKRKSQFCSLNS